MARHVVRHDVDIMLRGDTGLNRVEQGAEFARPVAGETAADDLAYRRFQDREQP
jgi:hypothetical protein